MNPSFPSKSIEGKSLYSVYIKLKANISDWRKKFQKEQPVWRILDEYIKKLRIVEYKYEKLRDELDYKIADFETGENAVWVPSYCLRPWSRNCEPGREISDREARMTRAEREEEEMCEDKEDKKREDEEEKKRDNIFHVGSYGRRHENLIDM